MKKKVLIIGVLLGLISCGKLEKQNEYNKPQEKISYLKTDTIEKTIPVYVHDNYDIYIEKFDTILLSKVVSNLKLSYSNINVEESSATDFNDKIVFLVVSFKTKNQAQQNNEDDDIEYFLERKYVFVNKSSGKIIAEETDSNLSYSSHEAVSFSKTYVIKNAIEINESANGIGLVTEYGSEGNISLYSRKLFTIITLKGSKINKIIYEYPVRKTDGSSNGGGTFQMEVLETDISICNTKTNGFNDLIVSKNFSFESEVEGNVEKGIKDKVAPVKHKKESEILKYNGKTYPFDSEDRHRFF